MTGFLGGLLERVVLVCTVVGAGLLPGFIAQYRQRLGGRLDQALADLAPWQKLAEQLHHGSLPELIRYHEASTDPQFHAEGAIIQGLISTVQQLQAAVQAMHGSLWRQAGYFALHADSALLRATYADWVPTFSLSGEGLLFALLCGLAIWLVFKAAWYLAAGPAYPPPRMAPARAVRRGY